MIDLGKYMVAPCGMNCSYCYVHHKVKSACLGCPVTDGNHPKSCRNCKIKNCVIGKKIDFCYQCNDFPCILIKRLDKSYRTRYGESLITNLEIIKKDGLDSLILNQEKKFKCPSCGSYINMHDKKCFNCNEV